MMRNTARPGARPRLSTAEAVTRQLGKVSGDAVVVTLQKQFSTAICYYSFKAYVGGGLTKIASCTVHQ